MPERLEELLEKAISIIERWNEGEEKALIGDAFEILVALQTYLRQNTILVVDLGDSKLPEVLERLEDELADFLKARGFSGRIYDTITGNTTSF